MKLGIVGSRSFTDYEFLKNALDPLKEQIELVISGGANGADLLGERWAAENNIPVKIFYPDWKRYEKRAGFIRNEEIVKESDAIVAFQVNESKGTQHTIDLAKKYNKKVRVFKFKK